MCNNKKGFTMVELLVVLVIVGILAAVATPILLANAKRAKASEAVATMGLIRENLREYKITNNTYFDVTSGDVQKPLPPVSNINLTDGALATANTYGTAVDAGVSQYFSNHCYTVNAAGTGGLSDGNGTSNLFTNPPAVDFLILVDGTPSVACSAVVTTNCAIKASEVNAGANAFWLEMDNSGRIMVSYDNAATWSNY